jgi:hypothetical protein
MFVSVIAMVLPEYWKRLEKIYFYNFCHFEKFRKQSYFENFPPAFFNILKEPLVVEKQTIPQQKALDLSFSLAPLKWAWQYQEGATPSRCEKHRCAWGENSSFSAGGHGSSIVMPSPFLSGS